MKKSVLISACLMGIDCKYNGENNLNPELIDLMTHFNDLSFIPVCPEQLGGLTTPRTPCEIQQGSRIVITESGADVSAMFTKGAKETLKLAELCHCESAILKENSPSCGSSTIYDGTFSHRKIPGQGLTACLLAQNGVKVFSENQLEEFEDTIFKHMSKENEGR